MSLKERIKMLIEEYYTVKGYGDQQNAMRLLEKINELQKQLAEGDKDA